jgi:hypothetical protein
MSVITSSVMTDDKPLSATVERAWTLASGLMDTGCRTQWASARCDSGQRPRAIRSSLHDRPDSACSPTPDQWRCSARTIALCPSSNCVSVGYTACAAPGLLGLYLAILLPDRESLGRFLTPRRSGRVRRLSGSLRERGAVPVEIRTALVSKCMPIVRGRSGKPTAVRSR